MSPFSAAVLEFTESDRESSVEPGNINSRPGPDPIVQTQATPVMRVLTRQALTEEASYDKFIAKMFSSVVGVKAISRERLGEKFRFYVVIDDSDPKTMEAVFDIEKEVYARFVGDDLEFEVLPGEELESVIPTGAVPLWRPS